MGVLARSSRKLRDYNMELQLTSMIDMFTILLVFLLKSYSVEYTNILVSKDLMLPISTETRFTENILNVIVTQTQVLVDGESVVNLYNGKFNKRDLDPSDKGRIEPLFSLLIQKRTFQEESQQDYFKGKIILQADRSLDYDILHKVLYTAGEAGYPKFKLLVLRKDE